MTTTEPTLSGSVPATGRIALPLGMAGLLMAVGGSLHPRAERATVRDTLSDMLGSPLWDLAHLLVLAGLLLAVGGFVGARRAGVFGPSVARWLAVAIVCWGLATVELVPHLLAARDLQALHDHGPTPMLDTHLLLAVGASPLFGLSAVALALAVARAASTVAGWVLAAVATVGGIAYAASSPLIYFVGDPRLSVLFVGQELVAVWLVGTAARVAVSPARISMIRGTGSTPGRPTTE